MEVDLKQLNGNWSLGFALHKHTLKSEFAGHNEFGHPTFNTLRSEVGEALYQLKFKSDFSRVDVLSSELVAHIIPKFSDIGFIVPMPPSKTRPKQPVMEIAKAVGEKIDRPIFDDLLRKKIDGNPLKDISDKAKKIEILENSFTLNDQINSEGCWNVLLIDDLFSTGASMETACNVLRTYSKINEIYVAALTWK